MGIFSWFGSRKSRGKHSRHRSLVRTNLESPKLQEVERAAAADVAAVREDEKYYGPGTSANQKDEP